MGERTRRGLHRASGPRGPTRYGRTGFRRTCTGWARVGDSRSSGCGGPGNADPGRCSESLQHPARARGAGTSAPTEGSATTGSAGPCDSPAARNSAVAAAPASSAPRRESAVRCVIGAGPHVAERSRR